MAEEERVCSYDRLGEGGSGEPGNRQSVADTHGLLTAVLDRVAGDREVVPAGHSLGGLIAARYAPDHPDRVAGLVLLDATPPSMTADLTGVVPEAATGPGAEVRAQNLAVFGGENPERVVVEDGPVRPAGDVPTEVVRHGVPYLGEIPEYGAELERAWAEGQERWPAVSTDSRLRTAEGAGHHIHVDRPAIAADAVGDVVDRVAGRA
ncbi:alpha/beta hydrolase [Streptomonospora sp. NEAU-YY374]|nr:alpha/beta hydrolase [Streptomonospora nanhaiensis]